MMRKTEKPLEPDALTPLRHKTVGEIMHKEVLTVGERWSIRELASFFMDHSISGAPVIGTDGSMVGVVSETDIVRYDSTEDHIQEPDHLHDYYMHSLEKRVNRESLNGFHIEEANTTLVRDIMTPMVFSVPQETTVVAAAGEMVRGRIHRLFVTSDKDIVGVISALDMLRVLAEL